MVLYLVIWLITVWKASVKSAHFHLVDYRDRSLRGGSDQRMENLVCTDCRKYLRDALIGRNECVMYPQTLYYIQMEMFPSIGQSPSLYYLKVERLQQNHVTGFVWYRRWATRMLGIWFQPGIPSGPSQMALVVKNPPANAGDIEDVSSIPGLGRSPGGGLGSSLQYSCWRIPWTDEPGRLWSIGSQKSQKRPSWHARTWAGMPCGRLEQ